MASLSTFGRRGVLYGLAAITASMTIAPLSAGNAQSELTVSVTVVRSCVIDAQSNGQGAARLRLNCATGAARDVRVSESVSASVESQSGQHVLLLNF